MIACRLCVASLTSPWLGAADFVISADGGQVSPDQGGLTIGLRGATAFEVEAVTLSTDVHSGQPHAPWQRLHAEGCAEACHDAVKPWHRPASSNKTDALPCGIQVRLEAAL